MSKIAVIGQGYVGLPLALAFAKHYPVIGYDINDQRVLELKSGRDNTNEVTSKEIFEVLNNNVLNDSVIGYYPTSNETDILSAQIYIVTVPTPIDEYNAPDLSYLIKASTSVGRFLKKGDIVIYESTVYPGCTEEDCVPVLEKNSGLTYNVDFFVGYSPERINPGDKVHKLSNVIKVTSGSTEEAAQQVDLLYKKIINAGTYKASSIKVAEASKAIENAQRDLNISFVNELALIFDRIGIDTQEVLDAAGTKYNFLKYKPGLVGGHCISVDPYYLTHKAVQLGYVPEVILSGRRVNNRMGEFVASKTIKLMLHKGQVINGSRILILGFTFKENCPDIRNTKVSDIYNELLEYGAKPTVCDPIMDSESNKYNYIDFISFEALKIDPARKFDAIILAVAHDVFKELNLFKLTTLNAVVFDCKGFYPKDQVDGRL